MNLELVAATFLSAWALFGTSETDLEKLAQSPAGVKISYGTDPLQFGELHLPKGAGPHPVVINIHGGCWLGEYNMDHSRALANALAKEGIAVWNLEYRRVGNAGGGWPGTFLDVADGADHLRKIAKEHSLDLSRVVVMGHSAGGQLALWTGARKKIAKTSELYREDPISVLGVIAMAPAPQLDTMHKMGVCGNVVEKLMGGSPTTQAERYAAVMPSTLAPIGVPQTIMIGAKDETWKPIGEAYVEKARAAGDKQVDVVNASEAGHFEFVDPGSTTWESVLKACRGRLGLK